MPTLSREQTDTFSPDLSTDSVQSIVTKMISSEVPNLLLESQEATVFVSTDPAMINLLRAIFEESNHPDSF